MAKYKHASFPGNPRKGGIINVDTDVPSSSRIERDGLLLGGSYLTQDQAIELLLQRGVEQTVYLSKQGRLRP